MHLNNKILKKWLKASKLNFIQCLMLGKPYLTSNRIVSINRYNKLLNRYFKILAKNKISSKTHDITFDDSASNLIDKLFKTYVDDNTLVVTSNHEHPSVVRNLEKCKNVFYIDVFDKVKTLDVQKLSEYISRYNKVFVYIVGTHVMNGYDTNFRYFKIIKKLSKNKKCIMVLDDVQAMFIKHKSYKMFDYIVGTGHALIPRHNIGILINKNCNPVLGYRKYFKGLRYIKQVEIILKDEKRLNSFNKIMKQYYKPFLKHNKKYKFFGSNKTGYLFHISKKNGKFSQQNRDYLYKNFKVDIDDLQAIRFRASVFITKPWLLQKSVEAVNKILEND